VKEPAKKRDELAHEVWATAEGFEDHLVLVSSDYHRFLAEAAVAAKKAGTNEIPIDSTLIYDGSCLVSANDLDVLREELRIGQERLTDLIQGYLYEPLLDETGGGFADSRRRIENDRDIQARVLNMMRQRKKLRTD